MPTLRTVFLAGLLFWTGCRRSGTGPLRVGYFPNLTHAQALVGVHEGRFSQALAGHLELVQFVAGPAAIEALLAGSLDATFVGAGPVIAAWARAPGSLHVIAGAASGGAILVVRNADRGRDLLGHRVAAPPIGNTQDIALRSWLQEQGLKFRSGVDVRPGEVTVVNLPPAEVLALFQKGQLAGAWMPEPWGSRLIAEAGARLFLDERTLWPQGRFPTTVLVASARALRERRPQLLALLREHQALTQEAVKDPQGFSHRAQQAFSALTHHKIPPSIWAAAFDRIDFTTDPLGAQFEGVAQHAKALGYIPGVNLHGLVDDSLLKGPP